MVNDPIKIRDKNLAFAVGEFLRKHPETDRNTFIFIHMKLSERPYSSLSLINHNQAILWLISNSNGHFRYFHYNSEVTRERLFAVLTENYPDHFEWLLFHPEWLGKLQDD